jgi:hypothetical protein
LRTVTSGRRRAVFTVDGPRARFVSSDPAGGRSHENVSVPAIDVALALYDAVNRDDREAALALVQDDADLTSAAGWATATSQMRPGRAGLRRWWSELDAQRIRPAVIVHDAVEVSGRAVCQLTVRGLRDGVQVDLAVNVWSVVALGEDGLIASSWSYRDERDALRAARTGRPA